MMQNHTHVKSYASPTHTLTLTHILSLAPSLPPIQTLTLTHDYARKLGGNIGGSG